MIPYKINTRIGKDGCLEIRNLPFTEGTRIEVSISEKQKKTGLQRLIGNDHIWTEEDVRAVEQGREIINQWMLS
jgi:hypothetical protein